VVEQALDADDEPSPGPAGHQLVVFDVDTGVGKVLLDEAPVLQDVGPRVATVSGCREEDDAG
jgi:hypothetical protein